ATAEESVTVESETVTADAPAGALRTASRSASVEGIESVEQVGGAVITLTKQTLNAETNEVLESTDYTIEIPIYAIGTWWTRFITIILRRYVLFSITKFLAALETIDPIESLDEHAVFQALLSGGAELTMDEFLEIANECGITVLIRRLFIFILVTIRLVGIELVESQVLPLLETIEVPPTTVVEHHDVSNVTSELTEVVETVTSDSSTTELPIAAASSNKAVESIESFDQIGGAVITLTKQTLNAETNEVISSTDYTVEIPIYAIGTWWSRFITIILRRFTLFSVTKFLIALEAVESSASLDDEAILRALSAGGAELTFEEFQQIASECGISETVRKIFIF
ncbi:hypothetical protein HK405_002187, partial [Cladochytrium tenue]